MEQQLEGRQGMPRSVVVAPVLMLVAGAAASVGLRVLLTQDPPRLVRSNSTAPGRLLDGGYTNP